MEDRFTLPEIIRAVENMTVAGTDFEKKLAELFWLADMKQLIRLKQLFKEEIIKYM